MKKHFTGALSDLESLIISSVVLQSIFEILRAEVDLASANYIKAKEDFWRISADVPTGFPHPDGIQRIENASRSQTAAMIAYTGALRRFNEFLLNGTIPEDVQKRDQTMASGSGPV